MVGLVQHGDLDRIQRDEALLHEVLEAAGAGDDDVDAGLEGRDLALLRDAAEDRRGLEAVGLGQRLEDGGDLGGELTRRREDEGERTPAAALTAGELAAQARHDGQREGEGLARAGLAAAEHVASGERVGQGVDLDGEGFGDAGRRE